MLAGALSMAAGEYVSVRSQREMYEYQIALEREVAGAEKEMKNLPSSTRHAASASHRHGKSATRCWPIRSRRSMSWRVKSSA